jgi:hypothetical protein
MLGLIGTPGHRPAWPGDRVRQFGDRSKGTRMPIDPSMLAKSIATLTALDPERDLASTLEQAVVAAKQLFEVDAAGIMDADADGRLGWGQRLGPARPDPGGQPGILRRRPLPAGVREWPASGHPRRHP